VLSVGRLDVNTSGLLLLTNCGHLKQVSAAALAFASCLPRAPRARALTFVVQALEQPVSNIDR